MHTACVCRYSLAALSRRHSWQRAGGQTSQGSTPARHLHHPGRGGQGLPAGRLKKLLVTVHPDGRAANGRGPKLLPETGLTRRERASLLGLRTGCVWTAARRYLKGRCASAACSRCSDPETLEHLLCTCPDWQSNARQSPQPTGDRAFVPPHWSTCSSHPVPICQPSGAWRISSWRRESRPTTDTGTLTTPILAAGLLLFVLMTSAPPHI
ncbi:hypothetical protein HPB52_000194 [Rhipicephalus sanguineus]|uniref:Tick transposon n=1 Tax=Rhipicephalus sanguineus TaxID=34632 RepID=A0A9D4PUG6_RHISA|nr:hypothetical protein HPB52_000194 [Rhipicephalus sanguineus]